MKEKVFSQSWGWKFDDIPRVKGERVAGRVELIGRGFVLRWKVVKWEGIEDQKLWVKNPSAVQETEFDPRFDPWKREWLPTPVFLPGESHG